MTLLVLAGSGEARHLLNALPGHDVVATLAGAIANPKALPVETRIGGFGGADGFRRFLAARKISAIVDATHPFASRITDRTHKIADDLRLPYLRLERPAWQPQDGDDWVSIKAESDAQRYVGSDDIVFLATGRQTLYRFANLAAKYTYCRQIDPPDHPFPFTNGAFVVGRPPFSVDDEMDLFRKLKITRLVVKNAGGALSRSKLDAARLLGIKVLMLRRPPAPECDRVETVDAALRWIALLDG